MKDKIDVIVDNEKEWRKYILKKVDKIDNEMTTLKIKVAVASSMFGLLGSLAIEFFKK